MAARKSVTLTHPDGRTVEVSSAAAVNDLVYGQGYSVPKSTSVAKVLAEFAAGDSQPQPSAATATTTTTK